MYALVILSSFILWLSFPNPFFKLGLSWAAWLFAVPLFYALDRQDFQERIISGLLFGLCFYLFLVRWIILYSAPGYFLFVLLLCIQPVLFSVFYRTSRLSRLVQIVYMPSAWVVSEQIRMIVLNGFSWGIGYSQSFNANILQISALLGSASLSFLLVLVNYGLYRVLTQRKFRREALGIVLVVLTVVYVFGYLRFLEQGREIRKSKALRVCTIEPHINPRDKFDKNKIDAIVDHHIELSRKALKGRQADLLIWPETAIPVDFRADYLHVLENFVQSVQTPLFLGTTLLKGEHLFNSAVFLDGEGVMRNAYHKRRLIPFSEYLPSGTIWIAIRDFFDIHPQNFDKGHFPGVFNLGSLERKHPPVKAGILICNEELYSSLFYEYVWSGASFVAVLLNDGWFQDENGLVMHAQNGIVHAVEHQIPVVRATNTGWSMMIDPYGRIYSSSKGEGGAFFYDIPVEKRRRAPIFPKKMFSFFCWGFVIITLVVKRLREGKQ